MWTSLNPATRLRARGGGGGGAACPFASGQPPPKGLCQKGGG